jgi:hypothetical protein
MPQTGMRGPGMGQVLEVAGGERVSDRQRKQGGADDFNGSDMSSHAENILR